MGEKYLGQLTAKSAPATGDILVLEDSEDTKKIDYDALANAILNKLTTKTYTVAGGTNTLIAAIDALNSNIIPKSGWNVAGGKCSEHTNVGFYYMGNATDAPRTGAAVLVNSGIPERLVQTYIINDGSIYTRWYDGNTFSQWTPQPTRTEMNAVGQTFTVTSDNSAVTINSQRCQYLNGTNSMKLVWIKFTLSEQVGTNLFDGFPSLYYANSMIPIYKVSATETTMYSMRLNAGKGIANGNIPAGDYEAIGMYA